VIDVRVFNRHGIEKDERSIAIERAEIESVQEDKKVEEEILNRNIKLRVIDLLNGQSINKQFKELKPGTTLNKNDFENLNLKDLWKFSFQKEEINTDLEKLKNQFDNAAEDIKLRFEDKVTKIQQGDDLLPTVMKVVKVFVAVKRRLMPGDKMAGRHGNKGVISKIVPVEDMPFLEDGTPVDVLLNPLGVPSRMNIGQILETHLGWAAYGIGKQISKSLDLARKEGNINQLKQSLASFYEANKDSNLEIQNMNDDQLVELAGNLEKGVTFATPVFDGTNTEEITNLLDKAGFDNSGQVYLHDGRSGERFERKVTVGYKYILKLHHLIDDKIHARSIGPYSLVTQQPLGGKAQFGGQRFGEMEVWALEAYGASNTLQEILTIKSDDVAGRTKVYEALIRGDYNFESGIPESFHVLVKELKSLGLNVELIETDPTATREGA
jgi:DNA-directed RNA polymerase subunit beta